MLLPTQRARYKEISETLWMNMVKSNLSKDEVENLIEEKRELDSHIKKITIGDYLKIDYDKKPKVAHLPDNSICSGQKIDWIGEDGWSHCDGRSWCNHYGTEIEIID